MIINPIKFFPDRDTILDYDDEEYPSEEEFASGQQQGYLFCFGGYHLIIIGKDNKTPIDCQINKTRQRRH